MQFKTIIIIGITLIASGCSIIKPGQSLGPFDESHALFHPNYLFTDANQTAYFVSDKFVNGALTDYTIENLKKKYHFLTLYRKSVTNTHDPAVIDTIYTFSDTKNKIEIYRAKHRDFVFTFDVTNSRFSLPGNIKPHMRKNTFFQLFYITETTTNNIQIANSEGTMRFLFYFEKNRLKRITTALYLD